MNPFTERSRIRDPEHFVGRWREVSMIFERLERRQPVIIAGAAGIGKSSLITHIAQSAGAVLELPHLAPFFLDLAVLDDAQSVYTLLLRALGMVGSSLAQLEPALVQSERTTLICLDGVESAIAAGWGEGLLEALARLARRSVARMPETPYLSGSYDLMLVAAAGGAVPQLSEPFAAVTLGAFSPPEIRLFAEAYLADGEISFSPNDQLELARLSASHPAYLQRAAFHLYEAYQKPGYNWRAAYLDEAREMPVPGAPLPPAIFEGKQSNLDESGYGELSAPPETPGPTIYQLEGSGGMVLALIPLILALIAFQLSASWPIGIAILVIGYALVILFNKRKPRS